MEDGEDKKKKKKHEDKESEVDYNVKLEFEDEDPKQQIKHISLFHDEFFVSSTMENGNAQILYSYLVGCNEA